MLKRFIHFVQYNNAAVLILALVLLLGGGAFAATEQGQELIGQKQTADSGLDNTLLLEADLDKFSMDFKIEKIEQDDKYYYVTYTYLDLEKNETAWEYALNEKVRKVSMRLKEDLGTYLAGELDEEYQARLKYLKSEQAKAQEQGQSVRVVTESYSGLVGKFLDMGEKIFPGYQAVKTREMPSPAIPQAVLAFRSQASNAPESDSGADNLAQIYFDYLEKLKNNGIDTGISEQDTGISEQDTGISEPGSENNPAVFTEPEEVEIAE